MLYIIPLQLKSFYTPQATQVLGQDIVFENIPWFNKPKDTFVNALTPLTTRSIIPSPFSNEHLITLEKGLHLHWQMPSIMKLFSNQANLPKVPTRWYIAKNEGDTLIAEWIVESDYIWDINDENLQAHKHATYPIIRQQDLHEGFDFRYFGRCLPLQEWLQTITNKNQNHYLTEMTALGWGTLNFDLHYANCRSAFGFHDPEFDPTKNSSYRVIGFYADQEQDFIKNHIAENRQKLINRISALDLTHLESEEVVRAGVVNPLRDTTTQQAESAPTATLMPSASLMISLNRLQINPSYASRLVQQTRVVNQLSLEDRLTKIQEITTNLSMDTIEAEIHKSIIYDVDHAYQYFLNHNRFYSSEYSNYLDTQQEANLMGWMVENSAMNNRRAITQDNDINTIIAATIHFDQNRIATTANYPSSPLPIKIAVADTLPEALTAILLKDQTNPIEKLIREEQIESLLNFKELDGKNLDWITRLRQLRHTHQFKKTEAVSRWSLKVENEENSVYEIPASIQHRLDQINKKQEQYDLTRHDLHHAIENIYLDWNYYVDYLFSGHLADAQIDANLIFSVLKNKILPQIELKKNQVKRLKHAIEMDRQDLLSKLPTDRVKLELEDSTSYYESLPPSLLLYEDANEPLAPTLKTIFESASASVEQKIKVIKNYKLSISDEMTAGINQFRNTNLITLLPIAENHQNWQSYKVEWEANFLNHRDKKKQGNYVADYLRKNYQLDDQLPDLIKNPAHYQHTYAADYNIYFGHSYINQGIAKLYKDKLEQVLHSEQTTIEQLSNSQTQATTSLQQLVNELLQRIDNLSLLEISLNDFNNIFIQRKADLNLMPLIPNAFLPHQELAKAITEVFNEFENEVNLLNPNPYARFSMFKDGALRVNKLRIIDTFGRYQIAQIQETHCTTTQQIPGKANWMALPPRLAQPATIHAEWLNSTNIDGPVFGWMMLNLVDIRLEFYDHAGKHIGSFVADGSWEFSPFEKHLATQDFDDNFQFIEHNPDLQKVLKWFYYQLRRSDQQQFFNTLFEQISLSLEYIEPENYQDPSLMECITTTPIALSKVNINLFVKGGLHHDLNKQDFKSFIEHEQQRNYQAYHQVRVPIAIGDYTQYNNGCIGYWHMDHLEQLNSRTSNLYFNNPEFANLDLQNLKSTHPHFAELNRLDSLYRNQQQGTLNNFLSGLKDAERSHKINKNDFISAYVQEGNKAWNLLLEMEVLKLTSLSKTLTNSLSNLYKNQEINGLKIKYIDDRSYLTIQKEERDRQLIILMHPKGKLFIKSGILPHQEIDLDYNKIKNALKRLELTLYAGPILSPKNNLELSLTADKNYYWSWIQLHKPPLPYRNRITQKRAIDFKKANIPSYFEVFEDLIAYCQNYKIISTVQPTLSQESAVYIVNATQPNESDEQYELIKVIQQCIANYTYTINWQQFQTNFSNSDRIYRFRTVFDQRIYDRLLQHNLIEDFKLFKNKKWVLLTELGKNAIVTLNTGSDANTAFAQDLNSLIPVDTTDLPIHAANLVEFSTELFRMINLQLVKDRYSSTSLLEKEDFYRTEDIYFILESNYQKFEKAYLDLSHYLNLKEKLAAATDQQIWYSDDEIWQTILKMDYWVEALRIVQTSSIKDAICQIIRRPTFPCTSIANVVNELNEIESVLTRIQGFSSEKIQYMHSQLAEILQIQITDERIDEHWQNYVDTYLFIKNNNQAISTIDSFNYSNTSVPPLVLKEGWLSIKSTTY